MKKLLTILLACLLLTASAAWADSITLTNDYGSIPQYQGYYVGPIGATFRDQYGNSADIPGGIICVDVASQSYFGSLIGVTVETLQIGFEPSLSGARFSPPDKYYMAAWLMGNMVTHPNEVGPLQFAVWGVFNDAFALTLTGDTQLWYNSAIQAATLDFADYTWWDCVYTPTAAFASNQEFMRGGFDPVPIPPSLFLLGSGLLGLALLGKRKVTNA